MVFVWGVWWSLCYVLLPAATTSESRANGSGRRGGASTNTTANGYQHTKLTNPIDVESIHRATMDFAMKLGNSLITFYD